MRPLPPADDEGFRPNPGPQSVGRRQRTWPGMPPLPSLPPRASLLRRKGLHLHGPGGPAHKVSDQNTLGKLLPAQWPQREPSLALGTVTCLAGKGTGDQPVERVQSDDVPDGLHNLGGQGLANGKAAMGHRNPCGPEKPLPPGPGQGQPQRPRSRAQVHQSQGHGPHEQKLKPTMSPDTPLISERVLRRKRERRFLTPFIATLN